MNTFSIIFEILMIIAFGFSWPFNIIRAYKARTTKGTSLPFLCLIGFGYIAGILSKVFACQVVADYWNYLRIIAFVFYCINLSLIIIAISIFFRNKRIENQIKN